jgi:hypothetical protein
MSFDFYGLGEIKALDPGIVEEAHLPLELYPVALAFRFTGSDTKAALVLLDQSIDLEMGKELGNVLTAKIAGQLSEKEGWKVELSPPQVWSQEKSGAFTHASEKLVFELRLKDRTVLVPVLLFTGDTIHV